MEDRKLTPTHARVRKDLCMGAMLRVLHGCFEGVKDISRGDPTIRLHDVLMSGFAMMVLKDPSLLAFERRRTAEGHNLRSIFHIKDIPCDTQRRARLDIVDPDWLRPAYRALFRKAQRGKALEKMVFMDGYYLISLDGTGYFSSEKLFSPFCLVKSCSKFCCALYREVRKKRGSKRELFETIRSAFRLIVVESMEMLYRVILAGPQKYQFVPIEDSS